MHIHIHTALVPRAAMEMAAAQPVIISLAKLASPSECVSQWAGRCARVCVLVYSMMCGALKIATLHQGAVMCSTPRSFTTFGTVLVWLPWKALERKTVRRNDLRSSYLGRVPRSLIRQPTQSNPFPLFPQKRHPRIDVHTAPGLPPALHHWRGQQPSPHGKRAREKKKTKLPRAVTGMYQSAKGRPRWVGGPQKPCIFTSFSALNCRLGPTIIHTRTSSCGISGDVPS